MKVLKKLFSNFFISFTFIIIFVLFLIISDYSIKKILPKYDPSGNVDYIIEDGVPLIRKKNTTFRQWKNTGDYNVSIYSNEYGLRNRKKFTLLQEDAFYVVGDSQTFGHGVEENERYSDLLENKFNLGEFVNIAIPGNLTGYYNLLQFAEKKGGELNKIILGLTLENDILIYEDINKNNSTKNNLNLFKNIKSFLTDKSSIYNLLTSAVHQNKILREISIKLGLIAPYHKIVGLSNDKQIFSTVNYIKKIKKKFNPEEFYILLLPSRGLWFSKANKNDYLREHNSLKKLLTDNDILVIDPLPLFKNLNDPKKYYFKYDGHFNKLGHSLIATAVNDFLTND